MGKNKRPASVQRGTTRPIGMTAAYALGLMRRQADREGKQSKAEWLNFEDGTHPTVEEAIEWLKTLDPNYDVVNNRQT